VRDATIEMGMGHKVFSAIALSSILPFLVIAYLVQAYLMVVGDATPTLKVLVVPALLVGAVLSMVAGGCLTWEIGQQAAAPARGGDDVVVGMVGTLEQQAGEIRSLATRLDNAYRELELANARLRRFSLKDDVTELYNRKFFLVRLDEEISRYRRFGHPVSVVLCDVDGFKRVNEALGHEGGDERLREFARLLAVESRDINVMARYGGDEFAILLVETAKAGALAYAERLREAVAANRFADDGHLTASFGVASLPDDQAAAGDILRGAARALEGAKVEGNRVGSLSVPARSTGAA